MNDGPALSRSPLLQRRGAVEADGLDAGTAWHYGDPTREQRRLGAGEAAVDLSTRGVVTVTGPDRLTWLDTLSTQWLRDLSPGDSREALILSPHGHVENALHVIEDGHTTWLTVEPGAAAGLIEHLQKMRFMLRVDVEDVSTDWAVLGALPDGAAAAALAGQADRSWVDPWPVTAADGFAYAPAPDAEHPGRHRPWVEMLIPRTTLAEVPVELAGTWASEALRVAAWRPRFGTETDHRTIPHEVDWLRTAVHLQKGCYRGQETVARVKNLGRPPRRLVLLHLDGSDHQLPAPGAAVHDGDRQVGRITTPARHHELGPIALAVVKRSLPITRDLQVDGVAASQEQIVGS